MSRPLDATEQAMLQTLKTMAGGMNPQTGLPISIDQRMQAGREYVAFMQKLESIDAWHEKQALEAAKQKHDQSMEEERVRLEGARLGVDAHNESRRIDLEYERLQIQKAEIVIRALEVAARNPELRQLSGVVSELSLRLLGGEAVPAINMLEDKISK